MNDIKILAHFSTLNNSGNKIICYALDEESKNKVLNSGVYINARDNSFCVTIPRQYMCVDFSDYISREVVLTVSIKKCRVYDDHIDKKKSNNPANYLRVTFFNLENIKKYN